MQSDTIALGTLVLLFAGLETISAQAFSARAGNNLQRIPLPNPNQQFRFPLINLNEGNRFRFSTYFGCPDNGLYSFSVTIYSGWNNYCDYDLMQNNIVRAQGASGHAKGASSGSVTTIIRCRRADRIWVRNRKKWPSNGIFLGGFSRFSGHKIG